MSFFTYETAESHTKLETYEWDNTWIEQTARLDAKRVLYIGDSISCGTRKLATDRSGGELLFDGFGTSKALDNPYLFDSVRLFASQQGKRDVVLFNNGLHGWHLDDQEDYRHYYECAIEFLLKEFPHTPIFLLLTTSVEDGAREKRVQARNAVVRELAAKYRLPIIDLYTVSVDHKKLRSADGVHYQKEGYLMLADRILHDITKE